MLTSNILSLLVGASLGTASPLLQGQDAASAEFVTGPTPCKAQIVAGFHCGEMGNLEHILTYSLQPDSTIDACRDACLGAPDKCESFSFAPCSGYCQLHAMTLNAQGFVHDPESKAVHYNRRCFQCGEEKPVESTTPVSPPLQPAKSATQAPPPLTPSSPPSQLPPSFPFSCANTGFQWAYFVTPTTLTGFDPEAGPGFDSVNFKNVKPQLSGTATKLPEWNSTHMSSLMGTFDMYGTNVPNNNFMVNWRGYMLAPSDGKYTFEFSSTDNMAYVWTGDVAYEDYNDKNALLSQFWYDSGTASAQATFKKGSYTPIRVMYGAGRMPNRFKFSMKGPDGTEYTNFDNGPVVFQSCDGKAAEPFHGWGAEDPDPNKALMVVPV